MLSIKMSSKFLFLIIFLCGIELSVQNPVTNENQSNYSNEENKFMDNVDKELEYNFFKMENLTFKHPPIGVKYILQLNFTFGNEEISLNLLPEMVERTMLDNTPVWTVHTDPKAEDEHSYKLIDKKEYEHPGKFYKDFAKQAVLYESIKDGQFFYEGVIGEGKNLKAINTPIPAKWRNIIPYNYKLFEKINITTIPSSEKDEPLPSGTTLEEPLKILYPKILVVLEANYFKSFNKSIGDVVKYMKILYKKVNLKYAEIRIPKIKVAITGIIISEDEDALTFYKRDKRDKRGIFDQKFIVDYGDYYFAKFFANKTGYNYFDSAIAMSLKYSTHNSGLADRLGICGKSAIMVNDDTKYFAQWIISHELAHSIGVKHDELSIDKLPNYGTILHPQLQVENYDRHYWSDYSIQQFQKLAASKWIECLKNNPFYTQSYFINKV